MGEVGIEPTVSGDKGFTGPIGTLPGLARNGEPAFIVNLIHDATSLYAKKPLSLPSGLARKWIPLVQPLDLSSSCLVPIERTNDTKHVWGLRAYAHPLAGRPADRIGRSALRGIMKNLNPSQKEVKNFFSWHSTSPETHSS